MNWTPGQNSEWTDRNSSGWVFAIAGRKFFIPFVDQAYNCGHWRHVPAIGATGDVYRQRLALSHSGAGTDAQLVLRDKPGDAANDDNSGFGFYFTGGVILIKHGTSGYVGDGVPYEAWEEYDLSITIGAEITPDDFRRQGQAKLMATVKHHGHVLAERESPDPYPFIGRNLHPWFWASRISGGPGMAVLR